LLKMVLLNALILFVCLVKPPYLVIPAKAGIQVARSADLPIVRRVLVWIPAFAGMTRRDAGMTGEGAGMTKREGRRGGRNGAA
jgi:hypothetical protein